MEDTMPKMKESWETLADIALFVEVAKTQSFARAATRLEMPPSTLSRRINQMEKRLGVQLFQRTTRNVALTSIAQPYYQRCLEVLAAAERAQHQLASSHAQQSKIRIAMPVDLGVEILGPIIADYASQRSGLRIDFDLSARAVDLYRDPIDLAFRIGKPMDERVIARKIGSIASGLYAAPKYLANHSKITKSSDLEHHHCLNLQTSQGFMAWAVGTQHWQSAPGQCAFAANSVGLLRTLAERGLGIALLPSHIVQSSVEQKTLVQVLAHEATPQWPLYAITASRIISPELKQLISFVKIALVKSALGEV